MVFVVYKINLPNKNVYTSGVYELESDAINQKKLLMTNKTPEEDKQELYEIHEVPLWSAKDMAKDMNPSSYTEEDNSLDESSIFEPTYKEDMTYIKDSLDKMMTQMEIYKLNNIHILKFTMFVCTSTIFAIILSLIITLAVNAK
jgi:hypothetical protein